MTLRKYTERTTSDEFSFKFSLIDSEGTNHLNFPSSNDCVCEREQFCIFVAYVIRNAFQFQWGARQILVKH